ncbi:myelin protein zero-like protein 2b [Aplochiton taeniatus]
MYRTWLQLLALLWAFVVTGVSRVGAVEVSTHLDVEAVNGTDVKLKCTFKSTQPVSHATVTVSWNFRPLGQGAEESVFYYHETAHPPTDGRFKGHVVWSGNVLAKDASITLLEVPPNFNGTYTCQVRNLPDVHGVNGEVVLRVVNKVAVSEIGMLAAAVGGAIGVALLILVIFMGIKCYRRRHSNMGIELQHPFFNLQALSVSGLLLALANSPGQQDHQPDGVALSSAGRHFLRRQYSRSDSEVDPTVGPLDLI